MKSAALIDRLTKYSNDDPANSFNDGHPQHLTAAADWLDGLADVYRRSIDSLQEEAR